MNISDFLVWLAFGGGGALSASWILEQVKWYQALASEQKKWTYFLACTGLSVGAYVVQTYVPAEVIQSMAPFFLIVSANFGFVFLGTVFHKLSKPSGKA